LIEYPTFVFACKPLEHDNPVVGYNGRDKTKELYLPQILLGRALFAGAARIGPPGGGRIGLGRPGKERKQIKLLHRYGTPWCNAREVVERETACRNPMSEK
jgi:hypothetical protein